jgi:hypothetical protein
MVAFLSGNLAIRMDRLEVGYTVHSTQYLDGGLPVRELGHQDGQVGGPGGCSPHTLQEEKCCLKIEFLVLEEWVAYLVEEFMAQLIKEMGG